jgi:hypothetical protein
MLGEDVLPQQDSLSMILYGPLATGPPKSGMPSSLAPAPIATSRTEEENRLELICA